MFLLHGIEIYYPLFLEVKNVLGHTIMWLANLTWIDYAISSLRI